MAAIVCRRRTDDRWRSVRQQRLAADRIEKQEHDNRVNDPTEWEEKCSNRRKAYNEERWRSKHESDRCPEDPADSDDRGDEVSSTNLRSRQAAKRGQADTQERYGKEKLKHRELKRLAAHH